MPAAPYWSGAVVLGLAGVLLACGRQLPERPQPAHGD
jgi:hypothetical protein